MARFTSIAALAALALASVASGAPLLNNVNVSPEVEIEVDGVNNVVPPLSAVTDLLPEVPDVGLPLPIRRALASAEVDTGIIPPVKVNVPDLEDIPATDVGAVSDPAGLVGSLVDTVTGTLKPVTDTVTGVVGGLPVRSRRSRRALAELGVDTGIVPPIKVTLPDSVTDLVGGVVSDLSGLTSGLPLIPGAPAPEPEVPAPEAPEQPEVPETPEVPAEPEAPSTEAPAKRDIPSVKDLLAEHGITVDASIDL